VCAESAAVGLRLWNAIAATPMISAWTAVLVFGLSAGLAPGPLMALVVKQSLQHGAREGLKVAVAPLLTDLPIIGATLFLLASLTRFNAVLGVVSCIGGAYVMYLAWESLHTRAVAVDPAPVTAHSLRQGVIINVLNPHPYLFWITVGAPLLLKLDTEHGLAPYLFLFGFYAMLLGSKALLAVAVGRSRGVLGSRFYVRAMRVLGVLLGLFAVLLIRDGLRLLRGYGA